MSHLSGSSRFLLAVLVSLAALLTPAPALVTAADTHRAAQTSALLCRVESVNKYINARQWYVSWANCTENGTPTEDAGGFITRRSNWRRGDKVKLVGTRSGNLFRVKSATWSK